MTWQKSSGEDSYIGVLSVDTGDEIVEDKFLFIFVWKKEEISVEGASVEPEAGFVCNPVPVSESRSGRRISGHIMDECRVKRVEE